MLISVSRERGPRCFLWLKSEQEFPKNSLKNQICSCNVANVMVLPVPMLPISNWELILAIGNIFTLATFLTFQKERH